MKTKSWSDGSLYYDVNGNNSMRTRLLTLLQMITVVAVAVTLKDFFHGYHQSFVIASAIVQLLLIYLYWSTGYYDHDHKAFNRFYLIQYSIGFFLLIVAAFTGFHAAIILCSLALLSNITVNVFNAKSVTKTFQSQGETYSISASMVERFGLFTIIVLGETIFGITNSVAEISNKNLTTVIEFSTGILIAFLLWSLYFDILGDKKVKNGYKYFIFITKVYLILLFSIGVVGACIGSFLSPQHQQSDNVTQWIFCISLSITLLSILLLANMREHSREELSYTAPAYRLITMITGFILAVPLFNTYLNTLSFMLIIALALFIPVLAGIVGWIRSKIHSE
jgi:low temperature requirement protein LtrA